MVLCSNWVKEGDTVGPAWFGMPLLPALKRIREQHKLRVVQVFAYLDDISIGYEGHPECDTLWRRCSSSRASCPSLSSPSIHDVRITEGGRGKVVGVPIGNMMRTYRCTVESTMDGDT